MSPLHTHDLRITKVSPLLPPALLLEELPVDEACATVVLRARSALMQVMDGSDDRLLAIVGPCSIHDVDAALEYGTRLALEAERHRDALLLIMRVYFEKPRTTVGWKGLINDPDLDGSFRINKGLRVARALMLSLLQRSIPVGTEFLDTITPQFISDLVSWGAIGARTSESQVHRELASGLSMPVGFKNGTDGSVQTALDAVRTASHPHHFLSVTKQGIHAIVSTRGNERCHVILRGGKSGTNYEPEHVAECVRALERASLLPRVVVDASHGNSRKDHRNQATVVHSVCEQLRAGRRDVFGVMIESHLVEGRQELAAGTNLVYGQSITDACVSFEQTQELLQQLAEAIRARRACAGRAAE